MGRVPPLVEEFLKEMRLEKDAPATTRDAYRVDLTQYSEFLGAEKLVGISGEYPDLSQADRLCVRAFIASRSEKDSKSTLRRKLSAIRSFYNFLRRSGRVGQNPARLVSQSKKRELLPEVMSVKETRSLLDSEIKGELALRDLALLEMLYSTGARVSEIVGANLENLDADLGVLKVLGKRRKERLVMIGDPAKETFQAYLEQTDCLRRKLFGDAMKGPLFLTRHGKRLSRESAGHIAKKYGLASGVGRHVTPHTFRHSFATHMLERGANLREIQEMLGHASLSTTQIYTHLSVEHIRDVYEKSHPRGKKSG